MMLVELRSSEGNKCPGLVMIMQFCSNQLRTEPLYLCPKNFSANHMPVWAGLAYYLV